MVIVATPVYMVVDAQTFQQKPVKNFVDFGYFRQLKSRDHRKNCWGKIKKLIFQSDETATDRRIQTPAFIADVSHRIEWLIF